MDLSEEIAVTAVKRSKCRSSGQARPPAHQRLRGRRHEAADGLVGPGHPKVGGSHHLRELHQVRVLHWRQTVAGAHVRPEGEEGGEEKRSSSTDGRRQGRDWFSKERQSGVPARDEWRKKALGSFALFILFFTPNCPGSLSLRKLSGGHFAPPASKTLCEPGVSFTSWVSTLSSQSRWTDYTSWPETTC